MIEHIFPDIVDWGYVVTSDITCEYSCIAWAAGDDTRQWWPSPDEGTAYWPPAAPRTLSVDAFAIACATLGYATCEEDDFEVGFEKVALFADGSGKPTHAARQINEIGWTSKVGRLQDIRHPLRALEGEKYGRVVRIMKRSLPTPR